MATTTQTRASAIFTRTPEQQIAQLRDALNENALLLADPDVANYIRKTALQGGRLDEVLRLARCAMNATRTTNA